MQITRSKAISDFVGLGLKKRAFIYSLGQMLLSGSSKKSKEILRKGINIKINKRLSQKYRKVLSEFNTNLPIINAPSNIRRVWFYVASTVEEQSPLVEKCYKSICSTFKDYEIIKFSYKNLDEYITLPAFILEKLKKSIISVEHFRDIVRIAVLAEYGGVWVDTSVYCSPMCPVSNYMIDTDFFVFQNLKPSLNGNVFNCSTWFMSSRPKCRIVLAVRELLWSYWEREDRLVDENLLCHFLYIVSQYYNDDWRRMYQYPSSLSNVLLLSIEEPYEQDKFDAILSCSPFQKLSLSIEENREQFHPNSVYSFFMSM